MTQGNLEIAYWSRQAHKWFLGLLYSKNSTRLFLEESGHQSGFLHIVRLITPHDILKMVFASWTLQPPFCYVISHSVFGLAFVILSCFRWFYWTRTSARTIKLFFYNMFIINNTDARDNHNIVGVPIYRQTFLAWTICCPISDHVMMPLRILGFKFSHSLLCLWLHNLLDG